MFCTSILTADEQPNAKHLTQRQTSSRFRPLNHSTNGALLPARDGRPLSCCPGGHAAHSSTRRFEGPQPMFTHPRKIGRSSKHQDNSSSSDESERRPRVSGPRGKSRPCLFPQGDCPPPPRARGHKATSPWHRDECGALWSLERLLRSFSRGVRVRALIPQRQHGTRYALKLPTKHGFYKARHCLTRPLCTAGICTGDLPKTSST